VHIEIQLSAMKRFIVLTVSWWVLIFSYVSAPCMLVGEIDYYTMALFACQRLEGLPVELPTLSLVLCLVLCIVLLPNSMLQVSAFRWNALMHSIGVATLAICLLKPLLSSSTTFNTTFIESMEFIGIVTGRAAAVYLAVMLLVISRRSVLSEWHSLDYTETIAFHRLAGWWVLVMSLLHSLAFAAYYLQRGGWHELLEATVPVALSCKDPEDPLCWNTLGLVNGFGVVATFSVSILAILSREQVRRSAYNLFYFTHVALSFLFILFCGLHDFPMVILMFPGLAFYMKDRIVAFFTRQELSEVTAEVLCRTGASNIILLTWNTAPELKFMPGTRWVYLHERGVSRLQWHPYSVVQNGHRAQVLVKGAGDWSESLCKQVSQEALKLSIEGPYGKPMAQTPRTSPPRNLLLVAGGVGISPFIDLLSGLRLEDAGWQRVHLVWAVRGDEFGGISGAIDWRRLCERAEISVFVTSAEAESPSGMVDHRMGSSDFQASASASEMCRHRVLILSFVFITLGALAADFLVHNWSIWVRHTVHSLLAWASLARCVPLLLVLVVLLAVTLLNFALQRLSTGGRSRWGRLEAEDSGRCMRQEGGEGPEAKLCIQHAKPDLQQLLEQQAELGPVEVKVCGPQRMLASINATVLQLKNRGLTVELDSLESSL